jgi:hypothetical protein
VQTPTLALERMHAGESPRHVVLDLIQDAITVAEGGLRDPRALTAQLAALEETAAAHPEQYESLREGLLSEFRTTPLDPARPARDLLEDLLTGIRGCWLIYHEYADNLDDEAEEYELDDSDDAEQNEPEGIDDMEEDEQALAEERERIDEQFIDDVREQAEATNHDLT